MKCYFLGEKEGCGMKHIFWVVLTLLTVGCATGGMKETGGVNKSESADLIRSAKATKKLGDVGQMAVDRWGFLIAKDAPRAYEYLSPGAKSQITPDKYAKDLAAKPVVWRSVKFLSKACEGDACTVSLEVEYEVNARNAGLVKFPAILEEKWIKIGSEWCFVPEKIAG